VASVVAQTLQPREIIVVDDGSPDWPEAHAQLAEYAQRVTVVRKPNGGAASARNAGLGRATQEWVAFLDADDYWEPPRLERQMGVVRSHPSVTLVASHWWKQWDASSRVLVTTDASLNSRPLRHPRDNAFQTALAVWTGTVLVRRGALAGLSFDSTLVSAEDRDLWCLLAARGTCYMVAEPLATYVQIAGSLTNSDPERDCKAMLTVVRRHRALLGFRGGWLQEARVYRRWAAGHLARGHFRRAVRPALHRFIRQPYSLEAWWITLKAAILAMCGERHRATEDGGHAPTSAGAGSTGRRLDS
jgi:glycosyltransferase involved in cell wall biosynthesis